MLHLPAVSEQPNVAGPALEIADPVERRHDGVKRLPARALPSQNKNKTHCHRGHPLSGDNLAVRKNGGRICIACRSMWPRQNRDKMNAWTSKRRKAGLLKCGYTKNVIESTGRDRIDQAFAAVRETGLIGSADAILGLYRRRAIFYFAPEISKAMHKAASEYRPILLPKPAILIRTPAIHPLQARINELVPRYLPRDQRQDVISEITLAVLEGRFPESEIAAHIKKFVSASYRADHNRFGPLSLDMPAFREGEMPLVETISQGLWQ